MFQKAQKKTARLRLALDGPSGSGKTYTALVAASTLAQGGKIAVVDTERGSASLYADLFDFDVAELSDHSPATYTSVVQAADKAGYSVIVVDSLSHAWEGEGGALDLVDAAAARSKSGNTYTAWRDITPMQRRMIDAILTCRAHVVVTMRSKTEYIIEKDDKGRSTPRKIGMAPIQRQGIEYEFTVVGDLDYEHTLVISKSRCPAIADAVVKRPSSEFFVRLLEWLNNGTSEPPSTAPADPQPDPAPAAPAAPADPLDQALHRLVDAGNVTTVKGNRLGSLTMEQLKLLQVKTVVPAIRDAAAYLLAEVSATDLALYDQIIIDHGADGLTMPDIQPGATRLSLLQAMSSSPA